MSPTYTHSQANGPCWPFAQLVEAATLPVSARRLGAVLNGKAHPAVKAALCSRWRLERLSQWARGEASPTLAEIRVMHEVSGGFISAAGWRAAREARI